MTRAVATKGAQFTRPTTLVMHSSITKRKFLVAYSRAFQCTDGVNIVENYDINNSQIAARLSIIQVNNLVPEQV